jgi:DNA polymerase-1
MALLSHTLITTEEGLAALARDIEAQEWIGLDIETTAKSPWDGEIRLMQFCCDFRLYVIDLFKTKTLGPIDTVLRTYPGVIVGQNLKFEQKWLLHKYGIELKRLFDTFRASALIHNGKGYHHDLYSIYSRELSEPPPTEDLGGSNWAEELTYQQLRYAVSDVAYMGALRQVMKPKLAAAGLNRIAAIEFGALLPEAAIELAGFYLDKAMWRALTARNQGEAEDLHRRLLRELPSPTNQMMLPGFDPTFNIDSPPQMLKSIRKLGFDIPDTNKGTLAMIAGKSKVIQRLLQYRKVQKKLDAFGEEYLSFIDPRTNRIHPDYYPMLLTGRYATSNPNLQAIPREKVFRACFRAEPGHLIVGADYSQIELRVVAEISRDKVLLETYQTGGDVHRKTAAAMMKCPPEQVTKEYRQMAKPVNFGFCFGMQAKKLVVYAQSDYGVHMTLNQAEKFREAYFALYPGVEAWHDHVKHVEMQRHIARSLGGRLRYLEGDEYNEYFNHPVQSTNADGLKAALPLVYQKLKQYGGRAKMVHMVHDEILLEVDDDPELIKATEKDLHDGMVEGAQPFFKAVPVVVETASGDSWAAKG